MDKILKLLAERLDSYRHKVDTILDRMQQTDRNVDLMSKAILDHSVKFNQINSEIKSLQSEIKSLHSELKVQNSEIKSLNSEIIVQNSEIKSLHEMNYGMLNELLSISKRVSSIEEKG